MESTEFRFEDGESFWLGLVPEDFDVLDLSKEPESLDNPDRSDLADFSDRGDRSRFWGAARLS